MSEIKGYYEIKMMNNDVYKTDVPQDQWLHDWFLLNDRNVFDTLYITDMRTEQDVMLNCDLIVSIRFIPYGPDKIREDEDRELIERTTQATNDVVNSILGGIFGIQKTSDEVLQIESKEE